MNKRLSATWPDPDQLQFRKVEQHWSEKELLAQRGWYPLRDVLRQLNLLETTFEAEAMALFKNLSLQGEDPEACMGLRMFGTRPWAKMPVFSIWYRAEMGGHLEHVPEDWDFQTLLSQRHGMFSLSKVFMLLPAHWPLSYAAMQSLINRTENARFHLGAARLDQLGYVVFMPRFGEWARRQLHH